MIWSSTEIARPSGAALGVVGVLVASIIGVPAWLLWDRGVDAPSVLPINSSPVIPSKALSRHAVQPRTLFGTSEVGTAGPSFEVSAGEGSMTPGGDPMTTGPELLGIVGRLPDDAVALVRSPDGRSRTIAIGEEAQGWRLAALAVDAALFVKGSERVRVSLPTPSD